MNFIKCFDERSANCSITGKRNLERRAGCEDTIYIDRTPQIKFFGLADGQTGKRYCCEGGKEVLGAIFQFVADKGITQMSQYEYVDELQYELGRLARDTISKLSLTKEVEKTEFASTLLVLAYDIQTGDYVIIHLGDGGIVVRNKDDEIYMLSQPENGLTTNYTWLTTSQESLHHIRIGFGNIKAFKRILMVTDGATVYVHGRNVPNGARKMICQCEREELVSALRDSNPLDDASCIVIDIVSNEL